MLEVWAMMVRHIIITIIAIVINFKEESKEGKSSNYNFQDDGRIFLAQVYTFSRLGVKTAKIAK